MKKGLFDDCGEVVVEFMFSDLDLGIIQQEIIENIEAENLELQITDRLEMIIKLNNSLYSN